MPSVIGRIEGTDSSAPVVIVGAHLDSINADDPMSGEAPGADDDGSGTVNLIESFRKLTAAGFKPTNPVEFHWYAGKEAGLLGSRAISDAYAKKRIRVRGMLQLGKSSHVLQSDPI
jgi:bacterial leucyl aminopeptidase